MSRLLMLGMLLFMAGCAKAPAATVEVSDAELLDAGEEADVCLPEAVEAVDAGVDADADSAPDSAPDADGGIDILDLLDGGEGC